VPAELALEREDLIASVHALAAVEAPVAREVAATRSVWPSIAKGLPPSPAPLRAQLDAAALSAAALRVPAPLGEEESRSLTGPSTAMAGTYRTFAVLAHSGWRLIAADARAIQGGSTAAARFARANVPLYIESVYDAHFALAQIGKKVLKAFHDLGGAKIFGSTLPRAQVDAISSFYSESNDRLTPHVETKLGS